MLVVGAAGAVLSGCASSTPVCDRGDASLQAARPGDAALYYAEADRAGEGDCATDGYSAVGTAYRDAAIAVVRARAAETDRDVDGAVSAYRTALGVDATNSAAKDGLARLGRPAPALRPVAVQPEPTSVTLAVPWWPFAVVTVLLLVLVMAAWRLLERALNARDRSMNAAVERLRKAVGQSAGQVNGHTDQAVADLQHISTAVAKLRSDLGLNAATADAIPPIARLDEVGNRLGELGTEIAALTRNAAQRQARLERQIDDIVERLDDAARDRGPLRLRLTHNPIAEGQ